MRGHTFPLKGRELPLDLTAAVSHEDNAADKYFLCRLRGGHGNFTRVAGVDLTERRGLVCQGVVQCQFL